jgi:hypothetical protein
MPSSEVLHHAALVKTEASEELGELGTLADPCHPDDGGATFLQNVGSYKSHTA